MFTNNFSGIKNLIFLPNNFAMKFNIGNCYRILLLALMFAALSLIASAQWTVTQLKLPKLDEPICGVQFLKITNDFLLATANTIGDQHWYTYLLKYDLSQAEPKVIATTS